ncbi:hypothetical protein [Leptothoe sp. PORK10 BA2]|uniref:hypothetical protein n=1 Tax=Leptothoe sp. PORK10 BA2 TaxID=3110254 RepID=UPI002B1ED4FB|nr:hypothetical protein [Leptothoe sp. PORK10 BA2]MEA5463796.1 hypothetical protein [Leptothoe sp. PORK10 BA2]
MLGTNLLTTLLHPHVDRLGDINPQLLRELKGRLKRFPVITAIALSLLCQIVVMVGFWSGLPGPVMLNDMSLSTYPMIEWRGETQLSPKPMEDLISLDMANRDRVLTSGIVVAHIYETEPVRGDKNLGLNALNTIQQGDRLIKIDGQLITPSGHQLTGPDWQYNVSDLAATIHDRMVQYPHDSLTIPRVQKLINTTIGLEFYNTERGYYTVTLPRVAVSLHYNSYCVVGTSWSNASCTVTADKQSYQIDWPKWYSHIYTCFSVLIVFPLMGGGVFMLANNLADEQRRGTLNFLQLSPKSAFTILSGKLLGVPVCLYLAVGLLFPLHWAIGFKAGYTITQLLGFDLTLLSQTLIFYLAALLLSLSVSNPMVLGLQPWLLAAGVIGFNWVMFFYINSEEFARNTDVNVLLWATLFSPFSSLVYFNFAQATVTPNINLALGDFRINSPEYVILALAHAAGWYALLGHGLERRFNNSDTTLLKRRFSYLLTLIFATLMVGLTGTRLQEDNVPVHLALTVLLSLVYCIFLMVALSPARQTLKDWSRFRHAKPRHERLSLWQDLVIGDTSSPVVAIALNLLLLSSLIGVTFLGYYGDFLPTRLNVLTFVCCILMFIGSILFSTLVSQTLLMLPRQKNWIWLGAVGSISCLVFPGLAMVMEIFWRALAFSPIYVLGMPAQLVLALSLLGTLTTVLGFVHTQQLIRSGRSESQQLLSQA